ncbi:putative quorum-sensing-regulated virulence factor [Myxococcota bacterium]
MPSPLCRADWPACAWRIAEYAGIPAVLQAAKWPCSGSRSPQDGKLGQMMALALEIKTNGLDSLVDEVLGRGHGRGRL